ncbi:MAG: transglutaminase domain-containing protein [Candidatus Odinarchaeia archaeon]
MGSSDFSVAEGYVFIDDFKILNTGTATVSRFVIHRPLLDDYPPFQYCKLTSTYPPDFKIELSPFNSKVAVFDITNLDFKPGAELNCRLEYKLQVNPVKFKLEETKVLPYNKSNPLYVKYTQPSVWVDSNHPDIRHMSLNLAKGVSNPLAKAKVFFDFVIRHIKYKLMDEQGALFALKNGIGDCTEYSTLFCALCRAAGIPARWIQGETYSNKQTEEALGNIAHKWAEFYLEGYGWIPVDPTWGAVRKGHYFGELDNDHIYITIEGERELNEKGEQIHYLFAYNGGAPQFKIVYNLKLKRTGELIKSDTTSTVIITSHDFKETKTQTSTPTAEAHAIKKINYCPNCKAPISDTKKCVNCGLVFDSLNKTPIFCPNCGAYNFKNNTTCSKCGLDFKSIFTKIQ